MAKPKDVSVQESQVVSQFLSDANHSQRVAVANAQHQLDLVLRTTFERIVTENNKIATAKKQENLDFDNALDIACVVAKVKLMIHLSKMNEQMVQSFHEKMENSARLERYTQILSYPSNPIPLQLPRHNETPESYNERMLEDAVKTLEVIQHQQKELENHMLQYWGATNFEEGYKIQTHAIHDEIAESIDKGEFLELYEKEDGFKIDPEDLEPEASKTIHEELHHLNDEFEDFLENFEDDTPEDHPTSPATEDDLAPDRPDAPVMDADMIAKYEQSDKTSFANVSNLSFSAQLKWISEARNAFHQINKVVNKDEAKMNVAAVMNSKNNPLRLAINSADKFVVEKIHSLEDKVESFKKDSHLLDNLKTSASAMAEKVQDVKASMQSHYRPGM